MQMLQEVDTIDQCLQEEYNHLQQQFEWLADSTRIKLKGKWRNRAMATLACVPEAHKTPQWIADKLVFSRNYVLPTALAWQIALGLNP